MAFCTAANNAAWKDLVEVLEFSFFRSHLPAVLIFASYLAVYQPLYRHTFDPNPHVVRFFEVILCASSCNAGDANFTPSKLGQVHGASVLMQIAE